MKKIIYIVTAISLLFTLTSCEDWLEQFPHTDLADDEAIQSIDDAQFAMNGVYYRLRSASFYGRELWASTDSGTDDVVLRTDNSNRFTSTYMWTIQPGDQFYTPTWLQGYRAIHAANEVIKRLPDVVVANPADETLKSQLLGEAYFIRALVHFELVKTFAHDFDYQGNGRMGIPYMKEPSIETNVARNTIDECFTWIVEDLETAVSHMNEDKKSNTFSVGKLAAKAILARVYLYKAGKNDKASFDKAAGYAKEVIASDKYRLAKASEYEITTTNPLALPKDWAFASSMWFPGEGYAVESIFTIPYSNTESNGTNHISKIYLDKNRGYGDLLPSKNLKDLIAENPDDVRNSFFYEAPDGKIGSRKFFGPAGEAELCNLNVIRLSEMYLIAAEASVRGNGGDAEARKYLNELRKNRGLADFNQSGSSLLNEIMNERRKELCFEGFRLSDLKRLNMSVVRGADPENPGNQNYGLVYPNARFAAPISDAELNANNLMVQNEGYDK
ncbi:hypothetical protein M2459_001168 [Parabacteroides sp. PF5-5]|uniref:RagB/SusD family nutrient uptake outer membrane protein n=1 Tax=unclassified Parabacteroides TaxID=2649774 RepID=UPI002476ACE3|nr:MULTISPECIES: RagB/SusD family nutrient uptake outer membrane protein [unclassified Parabacteroides]MDH6304435.1 hypothetical protein [Parabacteroides sp. PH5-39]MDH6315412.1 hypothetical protein [Parabacteroides sp. PF5-13]MDH6319094.1 hypothetical protein [Parabacteroides sp. PH5-13]MDH6322824.1 hypothetical protein [Parabacteroides sp. PH5-8]MDH6326604.1 hypothetical protein [Parabacteroides sp. PH5-41]